MSLSCLLFKAGSRRYALESKLVARVVESDADLAGAALQIEALEGVPAGNRDESAMVARLLVVRAADGEFVLSVPGTLSLEQFDEGSILPLPVGYFEQSPVCALIAEEQTAVLLLDPNHLFRVSKCETSVLA